MKIYLKLLIGFMVCLNLKTNAQTTLNYFIGNQVSTNIELYWETPSEINIDYYQLTSSVDNCTTFAIIASIPGNGTTSSTSNYSYIVTGPLIDLCYCFRLDAYDFSGIQYYLDTVMVCYNSSMTSTIDLQSIPNLSIYPNPFSNEQVIIQTGSLSISNIFIYNSNGQLILSVPVSDKKLCIDLSKFEKGLYLIHLIDNQGVSYIRKLIKE